MHFSGEVGSESLVAGWGGGEGSLASAWERVQSPASLPAAGVLLASSVLLFAYISVPPSHSSGTHFPAPWR